MALITYMTGDATQPLGNAPKAIVHIVNDVGLWGRGFVLAVSRRWTGPEVAYRRWYSSRDNFDLGQIQPVEVEPGLWVINMIAQHGVMGRSTGKGDGPPIRYCDLKSCLKQVSSFARSRGLSIHMPRIGTGLAGGSWPVIERIIQETLIADQVGVTVYDFNG